MFKLNELRDNKGARRPKKILGRGIGSGLGKTSGRGGKGQTARSGVALAGFEGGQMPLYRRLPKRGFNNINKEDFYLINLRDVQDNITNGKLDVSAPITLEKLREIGVYKGDNKLKLLAAGEISQAIKIEVHAASKRAEDLITGKGGSVTFIASKIKKPTKIA
ncbi:50S ribosomal subunit protein L15 [Alphaproteobacteria bacterium]